MSLIYSVLLQVSLSLPSMLWKYLILSDCVLFLISKLIGKQPQRAILVIHFVL